MWNPFRKNNGPPDVIVNDGNVDVPGAFQLIWVRQRLPDAGAEQYSFETLDLPVQTPIGAGVAVRQPFIPTQRGDQPYFPVQHVALQGFGQVSGGIVSQPLFNPKYPGYSGISFQTANDPFPRAELLPAGRILT